MVSALMLAFALFVTIIDRTYSVGIYEQCAGEGYGTFPCNPGLTCFRRNKWYSSCQYSCPRNLDWECETYIAPVSTIAAGWNQCGGDGWQGPKVCAAGYACYARSVHYSQCRPINDCPFDWACAALIVTTTPPVPVGPTVLAPYTKCNNVIYSICPAGYGCFRSNNLYAECRPSCPQTWACETDVLGPAEQCGGEGYVGVTRCVPGLRCYMRSKWYSHCAASCPGVGWAC
ncbi:unnamed protein product [Adineta ricciae]|uniref:CBM1 domain-containing protein n=1 Tax=Adineta ricciae TaxID=249248 RepID=A0A814ETA8_ADIRI|nr:unnamed protein product [Adineta ricciae]CAF0973689.1 unnamed protein product [Adineta ricciae]